MKFIAVFFVTIFAFSTLANTGSVELIEGRLKIQFRLQKEHSQGSYQLRHILEQHGFQNEDGTVRTNDALAPLEIYNYLYDSGDYVFTIFLPVDDNGFFISFGPKGFISFSGVAAQRLFDVIKNYLLRIDINNLEKYKWGEGPYWSYCDKTKTGSLEYRCWINW